VAIPMGWPLVARSAINGTGFANRLRRDLRPYLTWRPYQAGLAMLVLRRKVGEGILIDGQIEVKVLQIRSGRVQLAFAAPPTVRILREEIVNVNAKIALPMADPQHVAGSCDRNLTSLS
jgi:carbon storage regulator